MQQSYQTISTCQRAGKVDDIGEVACGQYFTIIVTSLVMFLVLGKMILTMRLSTTDSNIFQMVLHLLPKKLSTESPVTSNRQRCGSYCPNK